MKYNSDFQEPHFCVYQNNAAHDLLVFPISVYMYKCIYSCFLFRWSWSLPSIIILTWGKCWRALCGGKFSAFSMTTSPTPFLEQICLFSLSKLLLSWVGSWLLLIQQDYPDYHQFLLLLFLKCSSCSSITKSLKLVLIVETNNDREYKILSVMPLWKVPFFS